MLTEIQMTLNVSPQKLGEISTEKKIGATSS